MPQGESQDILCETSVQCFAVTSDYIVWVDRGTHRLLVWTRSSAQDIQLLTELEPWFKPSCMVASEDGCLVCYSDNGYVNFYTIDVLRTLPEADSQDKGLGPVDNGHEFFDEPLSSSYHNSGINREKCSILQRWSLRLSASEILTHADISPDGLLTALSTSSHLLLVLRSSGDDVGGPLPCLGADRLVSMEGEVHNCSFLSSHVLFNQENRRVSGQGGCTRTCFLSSDRLCILFPDNQLIAVRIHLDNELQLTTSFQQDGHIISHKHTVIAMASSRVQECLLVLGLSNGSVHILDAERLEVFKVLDTQAMLTGYFCKSLSHVYSSKHMRTQSRRSEPPSCSPIAAVGAGQQAREHAAALAQIYASAILDITVGSWIMIATPRSVLYLDKHTLLLDEEGVQSVDGADLREPLNLRLDDFGIENSEGVEIRCAPDGSWGAWFMESLTLRYFCIGGLYFQPSLPRWAHAQGVQGREADVVHAQAPLPRTWLRSPLEGFGAPAPPTKTVKSSNYTEAPWSVQQERKRRLKEKAKSGVGRFPPAELRLLTYRPRSPYEAHPFVAANNANRVLATRAQVHQAAVRSNCFTANGGALVTTSGDRSAYYLKLPLSRHQGDGTFLRAHTAAVLSSSVNMSLKTPLVATGGADGVIHIWKPTACEAPLLSYSFPKESEGVGSCAGEIRVVRFYYMDKFLCYVSQNRMMLSQHVIGRDAAVKSPWPISALSKARPGGARGCGVDNGAQGSPPRILDPIFTYTMNEAQGITAMDCINHFVSTLVVLAGSNKQICVLDLAVEAPLRVMDGAHSRQIHHVSMCTGSRFAGDACSLSAQHLFATSGLDGAVYVWDLRQSRPVRQFALHKNQALPTLGLAFSPDGSMLGVGSENDAVYVYDLGMGGGAAPLDRLSCQNVPTAIAWHPVEPLMAVGLANGQNMFFVQR